MNKGNGVLVLVLGIVSFLGFGCLTGIPAWVIGNNALRDIRNGVADPSEEGLVQAGRVLGIISTVLAIGGICIYLTIVMGVLGLGAASSTHVR